MAKTEAQKRASRKFEANNMIQFNIRLNKRTDADVIEFLETLDNKRGFILELIREKMKNL